MTDRCFFKSRFEGAKRSEDRFIRDHDFRSAYMYVTCHPVFWTRRGYEKYTNAFGWNTNCSEAIWYAPMWSDGSYKWALELGAHIPHTEYTSRYHDLRLDVYGDTMEEAYVLLADEVFKLWESDGTEKENNNDQ